MDQIHDVRWDVKSMAHAWNKQSTNANSIIEEIREKLESKSMNL